MLFRHDSKVDLFVKGLKINKFRESFYLSIPHNLA
nr:MAG TPA: hypothetical protein [Caudoviricetes sp.]